MRILVTGASGHLGAYLLNQLQASGDTGFAWSGAGSGRLFGIELRPVDLARPQEVAAAFAEVRPELVIHAAALARVNDCHADPERARQINLEGTGLLANHCARHHARLVFVSTDLVFNGEKGAYNEDDLPAPLSVYGRSKAAAEQAAAAAPGSAIVRVSLLYGPPRNGRPSFFSEQMAALQRGRPITLFDDEWRTPLDLQTAAQALLAIGRSEYSGILHVGGPERLSRLEMGQRLAAFLGLDPSPIKAVSRSQAPAAEPRPRDLSLDCRRWRTLFPEQPWPTWEQALREMQLTRPPSARR